jgi:hypothetical protein
MFATWLDMPIEIDPVKMWTLSEDARQICLELPPLPIDTGEPVRVRMRFDANTIDGILERLTALRMRMVPRVKPDDQH